MFRYAGEGVIAYDYKVSEFDYKTLATGVLAIGAVGVIGSIAGLPGGALACVKGTVLLTRLDKSFLPPISVDEIC